MTIRNDEQLAQARQALAQLRAALASLEREVTNPRNFAVMAEGTLDEIARIERDVNAYLGVESP